MKYILLPWHEGTAFSDTFPVNNDEATFQQRPAKQIFSQLGKIDNPGVVSHKLDIREGHST